LTTTGNRQIKLTEKRENGGIEMRTRGQRGLISFETATTPVILQGLYIERLCKRIWKMTFYNNSSFSGPIQKEKKIINWFNGYRSK
jgi:hypothetical protein